jgi:uncharacterized lipoprotein
MRVVSVISVVLACAAIAGCFGNRGLGCEDPARYASSETAAPVRVPEGLSVPDESQALQIPSGEPLDVPAEGESNCLERPPGFFDEQQQQESN